MTAATIANLVPDLLLKKQKLLPKSTYRLREEWSDSETTKRSRESLHNPGLIRLRARQDVLHKIANTEMTTIASPPLAMVK